MQLKQLSYFAAIIEAKSFTAAARELFISQPTLSQSIQAFEKELGFRLLTRTSTGVAATELGELVLADAKRVLAAAQEAQEHWAQLDRDRRDLCGTVRLLAFPSAYVFAEEQIVGRSRLVYPNLRWQLLESRGSSMYHVFGRQQADLAVGDYVESDAPAFLRQAEENGLAVETLCRDVCKVAVSRRNPLAHGEDIPREAASALPLAYYSGGDDVADPHFTRFFNDRLSIELHSFEKIVEAAVNNTAVSPLAVRLACRGLLSHYDRDAVSFLTVEGFSLPVTHCLLWKKDTVMTPELEKAVAIVKKAYGELEEIRI